MAVFRKDGELETELKRLLRELWGTARPEPVLTSAD